jgi:uncharacterized protein YuzE
MRIIDGHPYMAPYRAQVLCAIADPTERIGQARPGQDWFYLEGAGPSRWLKVVVAFEGQSVGSVRTGVPEKAQAMTIQIGPYTFDRVRYDHDADVLYLSIGDPARAVDFDETPGGHAVSYDENGDLVGLTLVDVRVLLDQASGSELLLELPAKARSADLALALA